jgi:hypothetical protein
VTPLTLKPSTHSPQFVIVSSDGADRGIPLRSIRNTSPAGKATTYVSIRDGKNFFVAQPLHEVRAILRMVRRDYGQLSFDFGAT